MTAVTELPARAAGRPLGQKVALVTGGTRGIGTAISHYLAADGAEVAAGYWRQSEPAEKLLADLSAAHPGRPGYIATDVLNTSPDTVLERFRAQIPVGRLGRPEEVARVVAFLAADESRYITGQIWAVNGGLDM